MRTKEKEERGRDPLVCAIFVNVYVFSVTEAKLRRFGFWSSLVLLVSDDMELLKMTQTI